MEVAWSRGRKREEEKKKSERRCVCVGPNAINGAVREGRT
jgi:hypothetical protein